MNQEDQSQSQTEIDDIIAILPESLYSATMMLKCQIAPLFSDLTPWQKRIYINKIKHRTKAESFKEVQRILGVDDRDLDVVIQNPTATCQIMKNSRLLNKAADKIAHDPMLFRKMIDCVNHDGIVGERKTIGLINLIMDSRMLPFSDSKPQSFGGKLSAPQGTGKSVCLSSCIKFHPPDAIHLFTNGSAKSLYSIPGGLEHKALIMVEGYALESSRNSDNELALCIRSLLSEGRVLYNRQEKKGNTSLTREIIIDGPISFITTTTREALEGQLDSRLITVHPDTSQEQTREIIRQTARAAAGINKMVDAFTINAWRHFRASLDPVEVVIPFSTEISEYLLTHALPSAARRKFNIINSAIKTVALLYQKQRKRDGDDRLIAEFSDYAIALQLLGRSFAEIVESNVSSDEKLEIIRTEGKISLGALADKTKVKKSAISKWMKAQVARGVLTWCDKDGNVYKDSNFLRGEKSAGRAYICHANRANLPTPFELTGDPLWEVGGELHRLYNLYLDQIHPPDDDEKA